MVYKHGQLPDTLYSVRAPLIALYDEFDMISMGLPTQEHRNGRKDDIEENMTRVMLPLTKIIDIYSSGYPISLINPDEVSEIYQILEDYLSDNLNYSNELNGEVYQENRDIDIDRFASEMFDLNKRDIVNKVVNKKSGFDIGISKLDISNQVAPGRRRRRHGVMASYKEENKSVTPDYNDVYLTHTQNHVDPDKVIRTPKVRKRKRINTTE